MRMREGAVDFCGFYRTEEDAREALGLRSSKPRE
jgi:hypothetical protein